MLIAAYSLDSLHQGVFFFGLLEQKSILILLFLTYSSIICAHALDFCFQFVHLLG